MDRNRVRRPSGASDRVSVRQSSDYSEDDSPSSSDMADSSYAQMQMELTGILEERLAIAKRKLEETRKEIKAKESAKKDQLCAELRERDTMVSRIRFLEEANLKLQEKLSASTDRNETLQAELKQAMEAKKPESEVMSDDQNLNATEPECSVWKTQAEDLRQENDQLKQTVLYLEATLKVKDSDISDLSSTIHQLHQIRMSLARQVNTSLSVEDDSDETCRAEYHFTEADEEEAIEALLNAQSSDHKAVNLNLMPSMQARVSKCVSDLKSECNVWKTQADNMIEEHLWQEGRFYSLMGTVSVKESEISELSNKLSESEEKIQSLEASVNKNETQIKTLSNELSRKNSESAKLKNELEAFMSAIQRNGNQQRLMELATSSSVFEEDSALQATPNELQKQAQKLQDLRDKCASVEAEVGELKAENGQLKAQNTQQDEEIVRLNTRICELSSELQKNQDERIETSELRSEESEEAGCAFWDKCCTTAKVAVKTAVVFGGVALGMGLGHIAGGGHQRSGIPNYF